MPDYPELQSKAAPHLPTPPRAREATPEEQTSWHRGLLEAITSLGRDARDDLLTTVRPDSNGFYYFGANEQISIQPLEAANSYQGIRFKYGSNDAYSLFQDDATQSFVFGYSANALLPISSHWWAMAIYGYAPALVYMWANLTLDNSANANDCTTLKIIGTGNAAACSLWLRDSDANVDWEMRVRPNAANMLLFTGPGGDCFGVYPNNDGWFANNCSALSFTDRTPYYEGDALSELTKIKGKDGKLDHSTLPAFAAKEIEEPILSGDGGSEKVTGRDLGAMVSMLVVAIQQLVTRVEALEGKLA